MTEQLDGPQVQTPGDARDPEVVGDPLVAVDGRIVRAQAHRQSRGQVRLARVLAQVEGVLEQLVGYGAQLHAEAGLDVVAQQPGGLEQADGVAHPVGGELVPAKAHGVEQVRVEQVVVEVVFGGRLRGVHLVEVVRGQLRLAVVEVEGRQGLALLEHIEDVIEEVVGDMARVLLGHQVEAHHRRLPRHELQHMLHVRHD